jgi:phosphatidylserine/phosphatidylglycerophosphate/cardiolipin synthase-like enzyme
MTHDAGDADAAHLGLLDRIDRHIGEGIERATQAHHRRRLRRLGWAHALYPDASHVWAAGHPEPRAGNSVDVLIDGAEAFPAMVEAIVHARSHVHIAGWHLAANFTLQPGDPRLTVRNLLADVSGRVDVRVLVWAGAPLPVFHPSRSEVRAGSRTLAEGTAIRCAMDGRERPMHCHHEKVIVVDDEVAFVGGIDLTDLGGDRLDWSSHTNRGALGWHDVATRLRGPVVADVADHFAMRWREVTREALPKASAPPPAGDLTVQLVRTVAERAYRAVPRGDFRILETYLRALRSARRLIYLENQFLWSPEVVAVLADKLLRPPCDDFRLVVLLPSRANNGADDTRGQLGVLMAADDGAERLVACTLYARADGKAEPIYVHAKVAIVDDNWLTIGSANLNEHSLFNDSEMNVACHDPALARATRMRLWAEHLELPLDKVNDDPIALVERAWKPISADQLARQRAGVPLTHRMVRLASVSRRSERLRGPLQGLLVDG